MRLRTRLLLPALLLALAASAAAAGVGHPDLAVGDFWETRATTTITDGSSTVASRTEIAGRETLTVDGVAYDTIRATGTASTSTTVSGYAITTESTFTQWTTTGGALLKSASTTTTRSAYGGPQSTTTETVHAPPCESYAFPLHVGKAWTTRCTSRTSVNGGAATESAFSQSWEVLREESVTVPAGTFHALVLESRDGNATTTAWWGQAACTLVKTTSSDGEGNTVTVELTAYRCAGGGHSSAAAHGEDEHAEADAGDDGSSDASDAGHADDASEAAPGDEGAADAPSEEGGDEPGGEEGRAEAPGGRDNASSTGARTPAPGALAAAGLAAAAALAIRRPKRS